MIPPAEPLTIQNRIDNLSKQFQDQLQILQDTQAQLLRLEGAIMVLNELAEKPTEEDTE